ncbi:MAG: hypothetical protein ACJ73N_14560 [Bryobacteraceae bacterium]
MKLLTFCLLLLLRSFGEAQETPPAQPPPPSAMPPAANLLAVKRIYVAELAGGPGADALRELIIAGLDATKLFVLTDNPERADAVLKGAADDKVFADTFDSDKSLNDHGTAGLYSGGAAKLGRRGGYGGASVGERESHHIKERKHEAYAAVRLCNQAGDVLWSTTQESLGGKFRGASADVAAKIASQLTLDLQRTQQALLFPVPKP